MTSGSVQAEPFVFRDKLRPILSTCLFFRHLPYIL